MAISPWGLSAIGEPIFWEEMTTVQLAAPPLISTPYDGSHVTCRFSSIAAWARISQQGCSTGLVVSELTFLKLPGPP
jgi:hypothetical protein